MKKKCLDLLCKLARDFNRMYNLPPVGLCGISSNTVHLTEQVFKATFHEYTRILNRYPGANKLTVLVDGVEFFAIEHLNPTE